MDLIWEGDRQAFGLIFGLDAEVWRISLLSLRISGIATLISLVLGATAGTVLALTRFPGRRVLISMVNTELGAAAGGRGAWWLTLAPRNDREWQPDVARLPTATVDGSLLTIRNVRNFEYRGEGDAKERWETRTYDLDTLIGSDVFISFWGPTLYGHTIVSWEFADGRHLAVSIETRKETGEEYSALRGFFRQYELYYVVADERDVIGLRTNLRGETVQLYRPRGTADKGRALLLDYANEINALAERPRWYNALTQNCTTTIWLDTKAVGSGARFDWRLLANGYLPDLAYERGTIDTSIGLEELPDYLPLEINVHPVSIPRLCRY